MSELCLKNEKVLTIRDIDGVPREIQRIDNPELLPLSLKKKCTNETLLDWLAKRNIPDTRDGLKEMKRDFGTSWLKNKNYASLSDHYWLKKRTESWNSINFFTNFYSRDIGDMAFMPWQISKNKIDSKSPDLTTNGILRKRWIQRSDKTSYLVKAGNVQTHQEPLSEVLVSVFVEQIGKVVSAGYSLHVEGLTMCSRCDNFITLDTELVPASYFYFDEERASNETAYAHLLKMCEKLEIPGAKEYIDWVVFIDKFTGNEDRNLSNIAFLRDVNTLKFIGPAPLYDCGAAYWSTYSNVNNAVKSKMFNDVEKNIIKHLKKNVDFDKILKSKKYKHLIGAYPSIDNDRKDALIKAIEKRNETLALNRQSLEI